MKSTFAVIPARNEERTITQVVRGACEHSIRVLVVNDRSSDRTQELAAKAGANVITLHNGTGYSAALLAGCEFALSEGASEIITLDADGAHAASDVPRMVEAHRKGGAALTIGERFNEPVDCLPSAKIWANFFATKLVNRVVGSDLKDVACGFRVLSRDFANELVRFGDMPGFSLAFVCIRLAVQRRQRICGTSVRVLYDATELAYTAQGELLDLIVACINSTKCDRMRSELDKIADAVRSLTPMTLTIGQRVLCLLPVEGRGFLFQCQPKEFERETVGTFVSLEG